MEKPYIPEKWKNLRLEIKTNDNVKDNYKFCEPKIIKTDSILKNKKDVLKENHKKCEVEDCYNPIINHKCVIL